MNSPNEEQMQAEMSAWKAQTPLAAIVVSTESVPFLISILQLAASHPQLDPDARAKIRFFVDAMEKTMPAECVEHRKAIAYVREKGGV